MGTIEGGWEFVWAAYSVTFVVLAGYGLSVFLRLRAELVRAEHEVEHPPEASS